MTADKSVASAERAIVAILASALAPTPVVWGWAPFETAGDPPSLPLVVVQRLTYSTIGYEDMCDDSGVLGDSTVLVHAWALGYEDARGLNAAARSAMLTQAAGWRLQAENDLYEPAFRAWRVEGQWFGAGIAPD
jgi:hypothetical protein